MTILSIALILDKRQRHGWVNIRVSKYHHLLVEQSLFRMPFFILRVRYSYRYFLIARRAGQQAINNTNEHDCTLIIISFQSNNTAIVSAAMLCCCCKEKKKTSNVRLVAAGNTLFNESSRFHKYEMSSGSSKNRACWNFLRCQMFAACGGAVTIVRLRYLLQYQCIHDSQLVILGTSW